LSSKGGHTVRDSDTPPRHPRLEIDYQISKLLMNSIKFHMRRVKFHEFSSDAMELAGFFLSLWWWRPLPTTYLLLFNSNRNNEQRSSAL
jgi:hypothetical protein